MFLCAFDVECNLYISCRSDTRAKSASAWSSRDNYRIPYIFTVQTFMVETDAAVAYAQSGSKERAL